MMTLETVENAGRRIKAGGDYYVTTLHDYNGHNLQNAMIYSDNIYFAKAALKIGKDTLKDQLDNLGFGESLKFYIWTKRFILWK